MQVVIDIVKHAVVGKFNDVRPGIYKEYMRDLCDEVRAHICQCVLEGRHRLPSTFLPADHQLHHSTANTTRTPCLANAQNGLPVIS